MYHHTADDHHILKWKADIYLYYEDPGSETICNVYSCHDTGGRSHKT